MSFPKTIYASVLIVDGKLKFWRISGSPKTEIYEWNKDFAYSGESFRDYENAKNVESCVTTFIANDWDENEHIFTVIAPKWFSQWPLIDGYKGSKPY